MSAVSHFARNRIGAWDENDEQTTAQCERVWPGDPTPEEIRQRSALIRQDWSETDFRRRTGSSGCAKWIVPHSTNVFSSFQSDGADVDV